MADCTLLLGEEKADRFDEAVKDLVVKRQGQPLSRMHYGDLPFLLGYAAAGFKFQWMWLSADGRKASFHASCNSCTDV